MSHRPFRICLVTALWLRETLERLVLGYYSQLKLDGVELILVAVGSEGRSSMERAMDNGWHYVEAENDPLSDKWNHGIAAAALHDPDAVVVLGSDDLLNEQYFYSILDEYKDGPGVIQLADAYFHDAKTGETVYIERAYPGAGTFISAEILRRMGWRLWRSGKNRYLDKEMSEYVRREAYPFEWRTIRDCESRGIVLVDIKTQINMWTLDDNKRITDNRHVHVDGPDLFSKHFPTVYGKLKSLTS